MVSSIDSVKVVDPGKFSMTYEHENIKSMRYVISKPYSLIMELNYESGEFIIEFTGKVLGTDYPQLISYETISTCFQRINELGACVIDPEKMMAAEVIKCDVTKDIQVDDVKALTTWVSSNISNYRSFICRLLPNGITIEKNVNTHWRKKRIAIYDKEKEMAMSKEKDYVSSNGLEDAFNGACRFELNLCSKKQIRETLGITGTTLREVLNADKEPIADFLESIISDDVAPASIKNWVDCKKYLMLQACHFNLQELELKMRQYCNPRRNNIPKMMMPFKELLSALPAGQNGWTKEKLLSYLRS